MLLLVAAPLMATPGQPFWVFFTDRPPSDAYHPSPRAVYRLQRRGTSAGKSVNLAVNSAYLQQLQKAGFRLRHVSRWFNAVSVSITSPQELEALRKLPFVRNIQPVARGHRAPLLPTSPPLMKSSDDPFYGPSWLQNSLIGVPQIHELGYTGRGVRIAVLDVGFDTTISVFKQLNIIAMRDFVGINPTNPWLNNEEHGNAVLSILAAYAPGELIGPAYEAQFILARTEDISQETPVEMDNWLAAVEWADSLGADIISSSLAYLIFDDPYDSYSYQDLDGHTTLITQAAEMAAQRGILVVTAMGNEGPGAGSLWAPADAPHALSVGAITPTGEVADFSSRGPTADGRIKPDVTALGQYVYFVLNQSGNVIGYAHGQGTSFATPMIAGAVALVLQYNPDLTPDSLISLFHTAGDFADGPDNNHGWGTPDLSRIISIPQPSTTRLKLFPNPLRESQLITIELPLPVAGLIQEITLFDLLGRQVFNEAISTASATRIQTTLSLPSHHWYGIRITAGKYQFTGQLLVLP